MRRATKAATIATLAGAGAMAMAVGVLAPAGATQSSSAAVDDLPPFAVEDFEYPRADQILAERGFLLKRGDGHIVLAECTQPNVLSVSARGLAGEDVCFRVTGDEGFLTMELPGAYLVHTNDYTTTELETTVDGESTSYEFGSDEWGSIGEAVDPESREHTLVEIRVSR
jgi:hypothetical protein